MWHAAFAQCIKTACRLSTTSLLISPHAHLLPAISHLSPHSGSTAAALRDLALGTRVLCSDLCHRPVLTSILHIGMYLQASIGIPPISRGSAAYVMFFYVLSTALWVVLVACGSLDCKRWHADVRAAVAEKGSAKAPFGDDLPGAQTVTTLNSSPKLMRSCELFLLAFRIALTDPSSRDWCWALFTFYPLWKCDMPRTSISHPELIGHMPQEFQHYFGYGSTRTISYILYQDWFIHDSNTCFSPTI
jgi:hypothetical protein